ncbi:hypothetical protein [Rubritalea tangerina]|uniref:hypothetical protein n=1 Tax=Rubritalea tangerina TaxID=430798 RepID=UPI003621B300
MYIYTRQVGLGFVSSMGSPITYEKIQTQNAVFYSARSGTINGCSTIWSGRKCRSVRSKI